METVLGLLGLALFIVGITALSIAVTYTVVKLTPQRAKKPEEPQGEA